LNLAARAAAVLSLLGCLLAPIDIAKADYDPIAGGTTRLKLDPSFIELLRRSGVGLTAVAPASLRQGTVSFPVREGKFDPVAAKGTVRHDGALVFRTREGRLPLKALQMKTTAKHAPLSAKLGGSQLKLANTKGLVVSRSGFDDRVRTAPLTLSAKAATRLIKKLSLRGSIAAGQPIGQAFTVAHPGDVSLLPRGAVELSLDSGFEAKLRSLFVAVNPIFPAEHPGAFTLPIFGGLLPPGGSGGTVETRGSLEFLQLGGGQVFWAESTLDLAARTVSSEVDVEPAPPYAGKVGPVAIATSGPASLVADPMTRRFSLVGVPLTLSPATAETFNEVFAKPQGHEDIFVAGEPMGTLSLRSEGQ
jgi:hypothetical protein